MENLAAGKPHGAGMRARANYSKVWPPLAVYTRGDWLMDPFADDPAVAEGRRTTIVSPWAIRPVENLMAWACPRRRSARFGGPLALLSPEWDKRRRDAQPHR